MFCVFAVSKCQMAYMFNKSFKISWGLEYYPDPKTVTVHVPFQLHNNPLTLHKLRFCVTFTCTR